MPKTLRRQSGLSLVELMVAIAIGLFLLVGLVTVFANSNRTYMELSRSQQQIENGRFATQLLADDVALAGFYGQFPGTKPVNIVPDPCQEMASVAVAGAVPLFVFALNNPPHPLPTTILACLANENHVAGTDILVIRRADTQSTPIGGLAAPEVYIQANAATNDSNNPIIATGTASNFTLMDRLGANPAPIRKYHMHMYFVAPCSIPNGGGTNCTGAADDGGNPIPTLKRLELVVDPADNTLKVRMVPLVEGIENLQIDYAIDNDGDGTPDGPYVQEPATIADYEKVVAVRINVLARNIESSPEADTKVYDLGVFNSEYAPGGNYKRHVYNAVVRLVNPSSRKEVP